MEKKKDVSHLLVVCWNTAAHSTLFQMGNSQEYHLHLHAVFLYFLRDGNVGHVCGQKTGNGASDIA